MKRIIKRIQAYLTPESVANERLSEMLIELRHRRIPFEIVEAVEDGQKFYFAKSKDYERGSIMASAKTKDELKVILKDAIFTAFDIPPKFCNPDLIELDGFFAGDAKTAVYATT